MATLQEFLEGGTLGPVTLGLGVEEVRQRLGEPEDIGGTPKQRIWKYGSVQLSFQRDRAAGTERVSLIGLYFREKAVTLPDSLRLEGWLPSAETTKETFERYLADHEIDAETDALLTFETQTTLSTKSGARVTFDRSSEEEVLDSIQLADVTRAAKRPLARRGN